MVPNKHGILSDEWWVMSDELWKLSDQKNESKQALKPQIWPKTLKTSNLMEIKLKQPKWPKYH